MANTPHSYASLLTAFLQSGHAGQETTMATMATLAMATMAMAMASLVAHTNDLVWFGSFANI